MYGLRSIGGPPNQAPVISRGAEQKNRILPDFRKSLNFYIQ